MKRIIIFYLFIFPYSQTFAEINGIEKIAQTGSEKDISVGWNRISLRTEFGDTITIDSCSNTGMIKEIQITGNNNLKVDTQIFNKVRYPDLRTLTDIWYKRSLEEISMFEFEFNVLYQKHKSYPGKYKVLVLFENDKAEIIIKKFNVKDSAWNNISNN